MVSTPATVVTSPLPRGNTVSHLQRKQNESLMQRPELYPGSLTVSRLLKLNETHYLHLENEDNRPTCCVN